MAARVNIMLMNTSSLPVDKNCITQKPGIVVCSLKLTLLLLSFISILGDKRLVHSSSRRLSLYPYRDFDSNSTNVFNDEPWFDNHGHEIKANRCGRISPTKINDYWYMVGSESSSGGQWVRLFPRN